MRFQLIPNHDLPEPRPLSRRSGRTGAKESKRPLCCSLGMPGPKSLTVTTTNAAPSSQKTNHFNSSDDSSETHPKNNIPKEVDTMIWTEEPLGENLMALLSKWAMTVSILKRSPTIFSGTSGLMDLVNSTLFWEAVLRKEATNFATTS